MGHRRVARRPARHRAAGARTRRADRRGSGGCPLVGARCGPRAPLPDAGLDPLVTQRRGQGRGPGRGCGAVRGECRRSGTRGHQGPGEAPLRHADRALARAGLPDTAACTGGHGHPCSPRQVRAGVPSALDVITCRALQLRDRRPEPPITTPAELAAALVTAAPPLPPPAVAPPAGMRPAAPAPGREYWPPGGTPPADGEPFRAYEPGQRSRSSPLRVAGIAVLAVVIVAGIVAASLHLGRKPEAHHGSGGSQARHHVSSPGPSGVAVLKPVSAHGFDADNLKDAGDENNQWAPLAIDGTPSTDWYTQWYEGSPYFGGLKHGTGLILDMGKTVRLSSLQITFGKIPGADVQIKIGNSDLRSPATVSAMTTVAQASDVGGTYTFTVKSSARGRYVLIWFTKLPPMAHRHNWYMAEIFNIVVRGSG